MQNNEYNPDEWEDIEPAPAIETHTENKYNPDEWEDIETSPADTHLDRNFTSDTGFDDDVSLRRGDISQSLQVFRGTTPDVAANVSRIAKENKVPYDFISNNKPAWEGHDEAKKVHDSLFEQEDDGTYKFPKTVAWLSDPESMAKSKDDIKTLTDIEYAIKKERRDDEGFLYKSYRGAVSGLNTLNQNISDIPATLYSAAAYPQNAIANKFDIEELKTKPPEWLVNNFAHEYYKKQGEETAPLELNESAYKHIEDGNYGDAAMTVYLQALNSAPTMAAMFAGSFAGLSQAVTLTGVGALEASGANVEGLERGKSPNEAIEAGVLKGIAEGFFEKYTLGMFKGFGKQAVNTIGKDGAKTLFKDVAKNIIKNTGIEGSSESATSLAQDFSDYITGEDDALEGSVERLINAGLVGGFMGTSTTIVGEAVKHHRKASDLRKKQQTMSELERFTQNSKLAERDPEGFKQFIDEAQGENKHLYMDADKLVEKVSSLKQSNDNDYKSLDESVKLFATELGIEDQIDDALKNGTELEIKTSDWLVATKDKEIGQELKNDIRFSVDGISQNEEATQRSGTIEMIEKLQKEHEAQIQIEEDLKPALEEFRSIALDKSNPALKNFKVEEVDFLLQLWKQKALTTAKNQGTSPLVELRRIIPRLNREAYDGQSGLYQSGKKIDSPEFKEFFGESKVVDEDGSPIVLYHGTTHDINKFDNSKGNNEGDFGKGFYFSNSTEDVSENYAGEGPDLSGRITREAEKIESEDDSIEYKEALEIARKKIAGEHQGAVMQVYVAIEKPAILGGPSETFFEYNENYDEEADYFDEPTGLLTEFTYNFQRRAAELDASVDETIGQINEAAVDGGLTFSELDKIIRESEEIFDMMDEEGNIASNEVIRLALQDTGFDGIIDNNVNEKFGSEREMGQAMNGMDHDTVHYIAFRPNQIKSINNNGDFDYSKDEILLQKEGNDPKGAFTREKNLISLFEKADFSTLVHESMHSWIIDMESIIDSGEGTKDIAKDFDVLMKFANSEAKKNKKLGFKDGKLTDEGHEILARAGETYFLEGKAPSVALMEAFRNFGNWLERIYKSLSGLDVELTDEVKGVFDRMFATQSEIDEAILAYDKKNSLMDLVKPTKREKEAFDKKKKRAKESSVSKLLTQRLKAFLGAPGVAEQIEKEATEIVEDKQEYKTIDFIISEGGLNKSDLIDDFGEATFEKIKQLDKGLIAKKKQKRTWQKLALSFGGINPKSLSKDETKMLRENGAFGVLRKDGMALDVLAEAMLDEKIFSVTDDVHARDHLLDLIQSKKEVNEKKLELGKSENISIPELAYEMDYDSPEQLLNEILSAKKKKDAIKDEIKSIKEDRENDILSDISDNEGLTAEEAIHNDITITSLIAEAQIIKDRISKAENKPKSKIGLAVIRETAKDLVENTEIKRAGRYDLYAKTEQKYATQAYKLFKDGKLEEALKAKELQILNHALVQEAVKARDYKVKIEKRYKTNAIMSKVKNTDYDFVNKAFELIEQFSLNENIEPLDDSKLLDLEELNVDIAAITPDWVIHENQKSWKDLTVVEVRQLDETIQDLITYGNNVIKSLKEDEILSMDEFRDEVVGSMDKLKDIRVRDRFDKWGKGISKVKGALAKTKIIEFQLERLDFYSFEDTGVFGAFRKLFNAGVRAETSFVAKKAKLIEETSPHWEVLNEAKIRMEEERGGNQFDIAGVPTSEDMQRKGRFQWTPEELIAIVLNLGNAGNIQAMENSYGFTPKQFDMITSMFTGKELQSVSKIWRATDTLFPELNKTHFKIYNRYLEKVDHEDVSFLTNTGERVVVEGGYYPLVFDHQLSFKAEGLKNNQDVINEASARDRRINVTRATKTKSSMTNQRVKNHSLPPKLTLDVWFTHISDTIRYTTHSEYLRDLNRVTLDETIRRKIEDVAGSEIYTEIRDWVAYQALPEKPHLNTWERALDKSRQKATAVILGANISVGVKQRLSMFSAMRKLSKNKTMDGLKYLAEAQKELGAKAILGVSGNEAIEAVFAMSKYLQARAGNIDKEISDSKRKLSPLHKTYTIPTLNGGVDFTWQEVQDLMFEWIQMNDRATVATVWKAGFNKFYAENRTGLKREALIEAAKEAADELVRTSQPSTLPIDLNGFQRGGVMMRLISPFMTWSFKYGNIVSSQYRKWQDGAMSNTDYFKHTMMDTVIPAMGNVLVGSIIVRGELPEWWELLAGVPETMISSVPLAREVTSLKYNREIGDLTAFEGARRYVKAGKSLKGSLMNDKDWNDTLWNVGRLLEYQTGVSPLKFIHDVKRSYNNFVIEDRSGGREPARRK